MSVLIKAFAMAPGAVLAPFTYVQIVLAGIHVLRGQVGSEGTGA